MTLRIDLAALRTIAANPQRVRVTRANGSPRQPGQRGSFVSAEVLAETAERYPSCQCDEMGLRANMPVVELVTLAEGCTERGNGKGWVCERLSAVRRRYGI